MEHVKSLLDIDTVEVADAVKSFCELWQSRSNRYPFYTLGKSAYLDGGTLSYYKDSLWLNEILISNFDDVYSKLLSYLSEELKEEVKLSKDLALPGFHIFPSDPKFLSISGNWHMDHPHVTLGLGESDPYAFTLPIQLPVSGGGMDWLNEVGLSSHLAYTEGEIVLHSGLTPHRIAGIKKYTPGEYRITLQGHLIRRDNTMEVFW